MNSMKALGQGLKRERELRGCTLEEIAKTAHIQLKLLRALENEEWHLIPGTFYLRQYIKGHLQAIGADENAFFNTYKEYIDGVAFNRKNGPVTYFDRLNYFQFKRRQAAPVILLALILGTAVFILLAAPRLDEVFRPAAAAYPSRSPISPLPSLSRRPGSNLWEDIQPVCMHFTFTSPCWLRIIQAGGPAAEKVYLPGEVLQLKGYQITAVIGNPSGIRLRINERPVSYLSSLSHAETLTVTPFDVDAIVRR